MNEDAIVKTDLKDYLFLAKTICACNESHLVSSFTQSEKESLERARLKESKFGRRPWYPLTRMLLARIVYAVRLFYCIECHEI